jgi:isoquinoline 1-oxidoreductase subunit beta
VNDPSPQPAPASGHSRLNRRAFLITTAAVGGGLALAVWLPRGGKQPGARGESAEVGPWLTIDPDDNVLLRVPFHECGNGAMTMAALLMAEELRADWNKVRAEPIELNRDAREGGVYKAIDGAFSTFSGRSTSPGVMTSMRQAGASARERLRMAAAQHWNVPLEQVEARDSVLTHAASRRKWRYGEAALAAAAVQLPAEPAVDLNEDIGLLADRAPGKLVDTQIVTGTATYGIDVTVPGMLYGALMQSPVHGGRLKRYDFDAVKNMPGVVGVAVVDPAEPRKRLKPPANDGESTETATVAIVAEHYWQARQALEAMPIEWDGGDGAKWKTNEQLNDAVLARLDRPGDKVEKESGDALAALQGGGRVVEATYITPFADQAPLEPLNAIARYMPGKLEVWHNGAIQAQSFIIAAEESGEPFQNVHHHQSMMGGHFGRRNFADDLRLVVAVAKKFPGTAIKIIWSREEMFRQGRYRWLTAARLRAALGQDGLPQALHSRVCRKGYGTAGIDNVAYTNGAIPNVRLEVADLPLHVRWGSFRAPGYNSYAFMMETFIDECATAARIDPFEYRRKLLKDFRDPGWIKSLEEVAARAGWGQPLPRGQGRGIAISNWGNWAGKDQVGGTTAAVVAHVEVSREGVLEVLRLDIAFDCGRVLNRDAVEAQMQGGVLYGLNLALNEEISIADGRVVEGNFDTYPMLRIADAPRIHVHFGGLSGADRYSEVGEPPVGPVAPAVANAIFAATGKRLRTMPFRKADLSWA